MRTVITLTSNVLAETTVEVTSLLPGKTHRARRETFQVGGKGVNVAHMARRLGHPARAVFIGGGYTGQRCAQWIESRGIEATVVPLDDECRAGWVVRTPDQPEVTFLGQDRPVPLGLWNAMLAHLRETENSWICLCGSIPGWTPAHYEAVAAAFPDWQARGNRLVLDTYGAPLGSLVELPWDLLKINRDELTSIPEAKDLPVGVALARLRKSCPVRSYVVTEGSGPVHLLDAHDHAAVLRPPVVAEVSPTGSGDVLLAGIVHFLDAGRRLEEAVRAAVPYAAANAAHPGVADFPLDTLPT